MGEGRCEVCGETKHSVKLHRGKALCKECGQMVDDYAEKHPWLTYAEAVQRVKEHG